jgi:hypothetical protein
MNLIDNLLQYLLFIIVIDLSRTCDNAAIIICNSLVMFISYSLIKIKLKLLIFSTFPKQCSHRRSSNHAAAVSGSSIHASDVCCFFRRPGSLEHPAMAGTLRLLQQISPRSRAASSIAEVSLLAWLLGALAVAGRQHLNYSVHKGVSFDISLCMCIVLVLKVCTFWVTGLCIMKWRTQGSSIGYSKYATCKVENEMQWQIT